MTWEFYTLACVLALSISIILQRVLIHTFKVDPYAYAAVFQTLVGLLLLVPACISGVSLSGIEHVWPFAIIAVVSFGIGHIVYAKTLQRVEASVFSVLFATHAVWVMVAGVLLLHETITAIQVLGAGLIFLSIMLLAKNIRSILRDKGTLYGLLTGVLFGIAIAAWSYVGRFTDVSSWAAISFIGSVIVVLLLKPTVVHAMKPLFAPRIILRLLLLALFYAAGSFTMLLAYKYGDFAIVSPLRQTGVIVTVLLALSFLPAERINITKKLIASAICMAGVILIVV